MSDFSKRADLLTQKLRNCTVPVKAPNGGGSLHKPNPYYCRAVFACPDRHFKMTYYKRGARRRYQFCGSNEGCNQQTTEPMFLEV